MKYLIPLLLSLLLLGCQNPLQDDETPQEEDTVAPSSVSSLRTVTNNQSVTLSWEDPSDSDLDAIIVTWAPDGSTEQTIQPGEESFTVDGLANGTEYTFTLVAVDTSDNRSEENTVSVSPVPPVANLTWTGAIDSDWSTAGNWSLSIVPRPGDSVTLSDTEAPNSPSVATEVNIVDLTIAAGSALTVNTDGNLSISGNLQIAASAEVSNEGQIDFTGSGAEIDSSGADLGDVNIITSTTVSLTTGASFDLLTVESGKLVLDGSANQVNVVAAGIDVLSSEGVSIGSSQGVRISGAEEGVPVTGQAWDYGTSTIELADLDFQYDWFLPSGVRVNALGKLKSNNLTVHGYLDLTDPSASLETGNLIVENGGTVDTGGIVLRG